MIDVVISPTLKKCAPTMALGVICCDVDNTLSDRVLWEEIAQYCVQVQQQMSLATIKQQLAIAATREVYKRTGKDPNRYRPSAEALHRRVVKGNDLYKISPLVDLINLLSLSSGYSIGGFDADKIVGSLTASVGEPGEPFLAIGRGELNVAGLPILRDDVGAIGTPTSDVVRTQITENTTSLLMNINGYLGKDALGKILERAEQLLKTCCNTKHIEQCIVE